jgi:hypothetical protein
VLARWAGLCTRGGRRGNEAAPPARRIGRRELPWRARWAGLHGAGNEGGSGGAGSKDLGIVWISSIAIRADNPTYTTLSENTNMPIVLFSEIVPNPQT